MDCFALRSRNDEKWEQPEWTPRAQKTCTITSRANGHGLKHDPFNAIIAPRPIGWISSRDAKGNVNLAPYSFFNGFCYHPPIIGFSSTSWKDSVQNIQETGEFVWNLATKDLAQADERHRGPCRPRRQRIQDRRPHRGARQARQRAARRRKPGRRSNAS